MVLQPWTGVPQPQHSPKVSIASGSPGKFEVYEDRADKFWFRLKASNGQVVASGEAYETMAAALKGCESVKRAAEGAQIVETGN